MKFTLKDEKLTVDLEGYEFKLKEDQFPINVNFFKVEGIKPENVTIINGVFIDSDNLP